MYVKQAILKAFLIKLALPEHCKQLLLT